MQLRDPNIYTTDTMIFGALASPPPATGASFPNLPGVASRHETHPRAVPAHHTRPEPRPTTPHREGTDHPWLKRRRQSRGSRSSTPHAARRTPQNPAKSASLQNRTAPPPGPPRARIPRRRHGPSSRRFCSQPLFLLLLSVRLLWFQAPPAPSALGSPRERNPRIRWFGLRCLRR